METSMPSACGSPFIVSHLAEFFRRYGICFSVDGPQLEYFVFDRKTSLDISCSLTVAYDVVKNQIDVMTFYPGLNLHQGTRYFSAVCFFMVIQHFACFYRLTSDCLIVLNTRKPVFDTFYGLLKDFDFHLLNCIEEDRFNVESRFVPLTVDISMINERPLVDEC